MPEQKISAERIFLLVHPQYHVGTAWNLTNEPPTRENTHQDWLGALAIENPQALRIVERGWAQINSQWGRKIAEIERDQNAVLVVLPFEFVPDSPADKRNRRLLEFARQRLGQRLIELPAGLRLTPVHILEAFRARGITYDPENTRLHAFGETAEVCVTDNMKALAHGLGLQEHNMDILHELSTSEGTSEHGGYYHRQARERQKPVSERRMRGRRPP